MAKIAYLLLGANIGNRQIKLSEAIAAINKQAGKVLAVSFLYQTEPWGIAAQDPFLNIAVKIETILSPINLLNLLLSIEIQLGRTRNGPKYGPRVIDIDIILFDNIVVDSPELTIPHPAIAQRMFTLAPLAQLAGNTIHPVLNKTISQLLQDCTDELKVNTVGTLQWQ